MKLRALAIDQNQRSMLTETEVPLFKVSETEWASARQEAKGWSIAIREPGEPLPGGPTEMHLTNSPSIVMCMQGHLQTTGQDGNTCRLAVGEAICLDGRALHHTTFGPGGVGIAMLILTLDGTGRFDFR